MVNATLATDVAEIPRIPGARAQVEARYRFETQEAFEAAIEAAQLRGCEVDRWPSLATEGARVLREYARWEDPLGVKVVLHGPVLEHRAEAAA